MLQSHDFWTKKCRGLISRLVDKMFKEQIGKNIEIYINDILVK